MAVKMVRTVQEALHMQRDSATCHKYKMSGTTWVSQNQKGKTRKVIPIWIYWSKK